MSQVNIFECKSDGCRSSVMAVLDFFSCLQLFQHTVLNSTSLAGCRTWCPTDLQHLCCKVLINKINNICMCDWLGEKGSYRFSNFLTLMNHISLGF